MARLHHIGTSTHFLQQQTGAVTMTIFYRSLLLLLVLGAPAALGQTCPDVPEGTSCTFEYDPGAFLFVVVFAFSLARANSILRLSLVTCNGCSYENQCEATAAGQTNCAPSCAEPDPTVACTRYAAFDKSAALLSLGA